MAAAAATVTAVSSCGKRERDIVDAGMSVTCCLPL